MEKPPSFSNFTFNTIKKNSLLSRLSVPFRQVQMSIVDSGQGDGDNSSVDMDVDSDSNDEQTALTDTSNQPNLLARLSGSTAAIAGSSIPSFNQHGATPTHPSNPAQSTNLSQVASNVSDQTKRSGSPKPLDSAEVQNGTPITAGISDDHPAISGASTSITADNNKSTCTPPLFDPDSLATPVPTGLPTPPPSGSAMAVSDAELPTHVAITPARAAASTSSFPTFVYTPLTQLLQEELAAWSEVWVAKRNQAGESRVDPPSAPFPRDRRPKPSQPDPFVAARSPPISAVPPEARTGDENPIPTVRQSAVPVTELHSTATPMSEFVGNTCAERSGKANVGTDTESSDKLSGNSRINAISISSGTASNADTAPLCSPKRSPVPSTSRSVVDQASTTPTQDRSTPSKDTAVESSRERPLGDKTIQGSAKPSGSHPASPRENELKALLKSRRAPSDMSLSSIGQNEERTLHTSRSAHPTPDSRDVKNRHSQQSASPTDQLTHSTSMKVPQHSPEQSTGGNVPAPEGAPVLINDSRTPESVLSHFENGHSTKRKVSTSQAVEKDLVQKGKKQKTASSGLSGDVPDSSNTQTSQPIVGSENATTQPPNVAFKAAPTLPPKPTFLSSGHKTPTSTTDTTRSSLKRTRSPIVKTEDGGVDSKLGASSSRPMKRVKVEEATNDVKVKKEEEEDVKIPGLTAAAAKTTHRGLSHIPTNIVPRVKEEERSIEDSALATAIQTSDESSHPPIGQVQSENSLASRIAPTQANSSTVEEQASRATSNGDSIIATTAIESLLQNQVSESTSQDLVPQHENLGQRSGLLERITLQTRAISLHPHGTDATVSETPTSDGGLCDVPDRGHAPVVSQQDCPVPSSNSATLASRLAISDNSSPGQSSSGQRTPQSGTERRMTDGHILHRGRSQGRQPLVDHWSPTRSYSPDRPRVPHVADTYRPDELISPIRSPRTIFDNRRYRDRERTPPRYSWRNRQRSSSRGRPPPSFRYSRSRSPSPRRGRPVYPRFKSPPRSRRWNSRSQSPPPRRLSPRRERYFDSQSRPSRWDTEVPAVANSRDMHALNGGTSVREGATRSSDDAALVVSPNTANDGRRQIAGQSYVRRVNDGDWPGSDECRQPANDCRADAYHSDRGVASIEQPSFPMPQAREIQTSTRSLQERVDSSLVTVQRVPGSGSAPHQCTSGSHPSQSAGQSCLRGGTGSSRELGVAAGATGTFDPSAPPVNAGSSPSLQLAAHDQLGLSGRTTLPSDAPLKDTDSQQPYPFIQRYRYVEPAEPVAPANSAGPGPTSESIRQDEPSHLQSKAQPAAPTNNAGHGRMNGSLGRDKPPHMQGKAGFTASANNANPGFTSETIRRDEPPHMQNRAQPKQQEKNNAANNSDSGPTNKSIKRDEPPHMQSKALAKQQEEYNTIDHSSRRSPRSKTASFSNDHPIPPGLSTIKAPEGVASDLPVMPTWKIESRQISSSVAPNAPPIRVSDPIALLSGRQENALSAPLAESQTASNQARERLDDIPKKHESSTSRNLADRISDESSKSRPPQKRRDHELPRPADSTESRNIDLASRIEGPAEIRQPKPLASRMTDNSAEPALVSRLQDFSLNSLPCKPPSPCRLPANGGKGRGISRPSPPRTISSPILLGRMQSPEREVGQQREPRYTGRGGTVRGRGRGRGQGSTQYSLGGARHLKSSSKPALEERFS